MTDYDDGPTDLEIEAMYERIQLLQEEIEPDEDEPGDEYEHPDIGRFSAYQVRAE